MAEGSPQSQEPAGDGVPSVQKIQDLLKSKDDTARFVGLAVLKSALDNSPELRQDEEAIVTLWASISPKFLDRLLRTGSGANPTHKDAKEMLDLAVSVLHTFAALLPDRAKNDAKFSARIPRLVSCLTHTSGTTEELLLQTLLTLVSQPGGASVLMGLDDLSPLIEIAPSQPLVLDIFSMACAWLQGQSAATSPEDKQKLAAKIDQIIQALVLSFKGTDGVTLLSFLANLLRRLDPELIPRNPQWLDQVIVFIRTLVTSRPTPAGREAYTNLCATLLQVYPLRAPPLLFSNADTTSALSFVSDSSNPFSYLLISLLLVDLRSSFPTLLEQLNSPAYPALSTRLASAFDIITHFTSHLLRSLDSPPSSQPHPATALSLSPSHLLSLRKSLSETLSHTIAYLRDRYDASVAGALGLHPSARTTATSSPAVTWDSAASPGGGGLECDPLALAALRALALWLREDDGDALRREAAGLADLLVDLYRASSSSSSSSAAGAALDFRPPVLVALEGVTAVEDGVEALLAQGAWAVLAADMLAVLERVGAGGDAEEEEQEREAARGIEIVRVLLPIVEAETPGAREEWMDVVTRVAAWDVPDDRRQAGVVVEFEVAVLQLVTALLVNNHPGVVRRYRLSVGAVVGVGRRLRERGVEDDGLREELEDVLETLDGLRA